MLSKVITIIDEVGIHTRPMVIVVQEATKFKAELMIALENGKQANLKSIMSAMSLGVQQYQKVTITAEGIDEEEALLAIENIMREKQLIA